MTKQKALTYRQGDVLFTRISKLPKGGHKKRDDAILAHGEVTGHSHAIAVEDRMDAEIYDIKDEGCYMVVTGDSVRIVHEEHGTVEIAQGNYHVTIQREYIPGAIRNVAD